MDLRALLSPSGRIGRLDWIVVVVGSGFLAFLWAAAMFMIIEDPNAATTASQLIILPLLPIGIFTNIKRAHDWGWSGWTVLASLIPFVGLFFLLMSIFRGGSAGMNKYGLAGSGSPFRWSKSSIQIGGTAKFVQTVPLTQAKSRASYCSHCGDSLEANERFCGNCGHQVMEQPI